MPDTVRRTIDLLLAVFALTLFALPALLIALAIRLDTRGPIFFSQTRLGHRGRQFRIYKFRKFVECGDEPGRAVTLRGDSRMTRVGRLLERTKLDELPQLWNLLKGDIAAVGPRPESLELADCFEVATSALLDYKPGLFGPSQVVFRNEGALYPSGCDPEMFYRRQLFETKARIDLAYFPHRTLVSDAAWLARGVLAVLGASAFRVQTENGTIQIERRVRRIWQPQPLAAFSPSSRETVGTSMCAAPTSMTARTAAAQPADGPVPK
ncbi:MAG: sugar transferase [Acidobacteriaceae bacterium]|nr:sugar transferase [Acidobacteriaceae bacterium]